MKIVVDTGDDSVLEIGRSGAFRDVFWCKVTNPNGTMTDFWVAEDRVREVAQCFVSALSLPQDDTLPTLRESKAGDR